MVALKPNYGKYVNSLGNNECFVFGSNLSGFHGAGSAGYASFGRIGNVWREEGYAEKPDGWKGKWNVKGVGVGFQSGVEGASYALPTVEKAGAKCSLSKNDITDNIRQFFSFARTKNWMSFFVAGDDDGRPPLNGYSHKEMARMYFESRPIPVNVIFSESYQKMIDSLLDGVTFDTTSYRSRLNIPDFGMNKTVFTIAEFPAMIATSYSRIVIGKRGPYMEFSPEEFRKTAFYVPKEEAYRLTSDVVFYDEYRSCCTQNVKAYFQKKEVDYADYRVGMWYVSPFELAIDGYARLVEPIVKPIVVEQPSIFD